MSSTRIITQEFDYVTPETLPEALQLLNKHGRGAKIISGGTDIVPQLKYEKISPACLINIVKIPELNYIKQDEALRIGASTKLGDVKQFLENKPAYACLYDALGSIGKVQVMNMGTLGGNLCTASPAADSAPPLLVLEGRVKLISTRGERTVLLADFFEGPNKTSMKSDEIMSEIQIPAIEKDAGNAFIKIARVAADISKISCAVAVVRKEGSCTECRIAMGAVAAVPLRIQSAESLLIGRKIDKGLLDRTAKALSAEIKPLTDVRSNEFYRRQVAQILFKDSFAKAWHRAGGNE